MSSAALTDDRVLLPADRLIVLERRASLGGDVLGAFRHADWAAAADALLEHTAKLDAERAAVCEALHLRVGATPAGRERAELVALKRDLHNARIRSARTLVASLRARPCSALDALLDAAEHTLERLETNGRAKTELLRREPELVARERGALREALERLPLQLGLSVTNHAVLDEALEARWMAPGASEKHRRRFERTALAYLSRVVGKTSPRSHFTTVAVGPRSSIDEVGAGASSTVRIDASGVTDLLRTCVLALSQVPELPLRVNTSLLREKSGWVWIQRGEGLERVQRLAGSVEFDEVLTQLVSRRVLTQREFAEFVGCAGDPIAATRLLRSLVERGVLESNFGVVYESPTWAADLLAAVERLDPAVAACSLAAWRELVDAHAGFELAAPRARKGRAVRAWRAMRALSEWSGARAPVRPEDVFHETVRHSSVAVTPVRAAGAARDLDHALSPLSWWPAHDPDHAALSGRARRAWGREFRVPWVAAVPELQRWDGAHEVPRGADFSGVPLELGPDGSAVRVSPGALRRSAPRVGRSSAQVDLGWCVVFQTDPEGTLIVNDVLGGHGVRWARFVDDVDQTALRALRDGPWPTGTMVAELRGSAHCVNHAPVVAPFEIVLPGVEPRRPREARIDLADLDLVMDATDERARLEHRGSRRQVIPIFFGFERLSRSPLMRLLRSLSPTEREHPVHALRRCINHRVAGDYLAETSVVRRLPRIHLGDRVVLQRATWWLPRRFLEDVASQNGPLARAFALRALRRELDLPELIYASARRSNALRTDAAPRLVAFDGLGLASALLEELDAEVDGWFLTEAQPAPEIGAELATEWVIDLPWRPAS